MLLRLWFPLLGAACLSSSCSEPSGPSEAGIYAEALARTPGDPEGALQLCRSLKEPRERDDCHWVVARVMVRGDLERATEICGALEALGRDECFFILAEELMQADLCPQAGRFEKNCLLHIFGRRLQKQTPPGTRPPELESLAVEQMQAIGVPVEDYPFWVAAYDGLFMQNPSLTAEDCDGTTTKVSKRACQNAAKGGARKLFDFEEDSQPKEIKEPDG